MRCNERKRTGYIQILISFSPQACWTITNGDPIRTGDNAEIPRNAQGIVEQADVRIEHVCDVSRSSKRLSDNQRRLARGDKPWGISRTEYYDPVIAKRGSDYCAVT